jgi:hypothetical protein
MVLFQFQGNYQWSPKEKFCGVWLADNNKSRISSVSVDDMNDMCRHIKQWTIIKKA